ncbi:chromate transporter [Deinococcus sp.]|uniref:chromate transporter n=1 Tax=Deinococcus sp. TaxID=47478 RepID=UPI0025C44E55|nr:chromate transporter [Deinococcus sp.]
MTDPGASWPEILLTFTRLGLISFGGANLAEIERVLVGQRHWITSETLASGFALGQIMPGPNMLAMTHYGFAAGGWAGAAAATLGFYGPTALLSAAAALAWRGLLRWKRLPSIRSALLPLGGGVLLAGVLVLSRGSVQNVTGAVIGAAVLGALIGL